LKIEQDKPVQVAIAVPSMDDVKADFAFSLAMMVNHIHSEPIPGLQALGILNKRTSILPDSRNLLAQQAIDQGFSHILWIDSDMKFQTDMLAKLLRHRLPIVGINASMRATPYKTTAQTAPNVRLATNHSSSGIEKVERMGLGVVLHEVSVLHAIKKRPWFTFEYLKGKHIHRGEDYYFGLKVQKAGYTLHIDHDVSKTVGHVGSFAHYPMRDDPNADAEPVE